MSRSVRRPWVPSGGEWLRFGLFLVLVAAAAGYVWGRIPQFLQSRAPVAAVPAAGDAAGSASGPAGGAAGAGVARVLTPAPRGVSAPPDAGAAVRAAADFFADFRVQRDRARGRQREMLQDLMDRPDTDPEIRRQAQTRYLHLGRTMALEQELEGLILARGYGEAAVYLGEGMAQVVLGVRQLTPAQAAQVAELVSRAADVDPTGIQIVTRGP